MVIPRSHCRVYSNCSCGFRVGRGWVWVAEKTPVHPGKEPLGSPWQGGACDMEQGG